MVIRLARFVFFGLAFSMFVRAQTAAAGAKLALTPPMGWNSWDSFGMSVTESEFKANASWLAGNLKRYGWQYVVVDEGWYIKNPNAKPDDFQFTLSADGRFLPAVNRFPAAGGTAGFKPLADFVHGLGLKFGIHIIRGIPKGAVRKDLPIAGSSFRAAEAADTSDTCPWNADNYGVRFTPAGQAYYDSLAKLYASWGLDFIKVDCIASHPYRGQEIEMISQALRASGRPIVLSLSPGPAPLDKLDELRKWAEMWRISDDVWDHWSRVSNKTFPQSVSQQFEIAAAWARYVETGHWPDADMLPIGYLGPRPGEGKPRATGLTRDEQRTLMTLWSMFRSPLFIGGNLTQIDDWTKSLLSNEEVLAVDQHSSGAREVMNDRRKAVWIAKDETGRGAYVALFNLSDARQSVEYPLQTLGLGTSLKVRDVWAKRDLEQVDRLRTLLAPHASMLYHLKQ
jgi:alpha-galactosidase